MNPIAWLIVLAGCLLLVALTTDWQTQSTPVESTEVITDAPDLYMEDAAITQYGRDGSVQYRLDSATIRHFDVENLTRLESPVFELFRTGGLPWHVRSTHGYIRYRSQTPPPQEEVVFLRENVLLEQRSLDGEFVKLTTDALYVYPDRRYAETDRPVMIDTNSGRTTAVGLQGDLGRGLLKLFSAADTKVHTIVLPDQFKR
jgi:lipopolysaccharide export system protein LptC